eukprot:5207332-Alexandrium_andersonii.AAC.1
MGVQALQGAHSRALRHSWAGQGPARQEGQAHCDASPRAPGCALWRHEGPETGGGSEQPPQWRGGWVGLPG